MLRALVPLAGVVVAVGCGSSGGGSSGEDGRPSDSGREEGQTEFSSAPPAGQAGRGGSFGGSSSGGAESAGTAAPSDNSKGAGAANDPMKQTPTVNETDLYRVDGDRLYYLNSYRGLMVFDISNVDDPKLLGRSPVFGTPVEMYVQNGIATVVVGDWYGSAADGSPFHGSVVRMINAQNPAAMQISGEVQVKGWARDMRVVGTNLYIVSEDYGWVYGMWGGYYGVGGGGDVAAPGCYGCGGYGGGKVVISSVALAGGAPKLAGEKVYDGYSGAFNVTPYSILMAHDVTDPANNNQPTGQARIEWIDITDPGGAIVPKGSFDVDGLLQGWGADNGRWNVNLDGTTAEVITCAASQYGYCNGQQGYNVTTVDFSDPAAPKQLGKLAIPSTGWTATARFDSKRMYLSPSESYYDGSQQGTPVEIYDLSDPTTPKLAGSTSINGAVWLFMPMGTDRLFALGNEYNQAPGGGYYSSSQVAVRYLDVSNPAAPSVIGTSTFGDGWAWTPAAGTFKAFVRDANQKMIVLPFSGWNANSYEYVNGVQLIGYDTNAIATLGAGKSHGWVERGIFVKDHVIALSDQSLTVVNYKNRLHPMVVKEMELARNVISAQPDNTTIAQLSTDWWGYDNSTSELRVLPLANAEELHDEPLAKQVRINGTNAQIFRNGSLAYVVTTLYPKPPYSGPWYATPQIQVVDLANGGAKLKGSIQLPQESNYYWSWWGGYYYWDWYDGAGAVQVNGDVLAFRRVSGWYDETTGKYNSETKLYVVDLANPDAPRLASTTVTADSDYWWGNMRVVGDTLYTTHYEWLSKPDPSQPSNTVYWVKYYLDQIDLSDRNAPKVGKRINVPGILVGADQNDSSLLYFIDYRWWGQDNKDELAVAKIQNDKAYLKSTTLLDGWVGQVHVRGSKAYMSAQDYVTDPSGNGKATVKLTEVDLTDAKKPVVRSSAPKDGWGWLVDVEGDRAVITSGWGQVGLDIYKLQNGAPPVYDQFARTRGWWPNSITRQDGNLYVSTGYWGVQQITLNK